MKTEPNTNPHPCESVPLEAKPTETPNPQDLKRFGTELSPRREWLWNGEAAEWVPCGPSIGDRLVRLRAKLYPAEADIKEAVRVIGNLQGYVVNGSPDWEDAEQLLLRLDPEAK